MLNNMYSDNNSMIRQLINSRMVTNYNSSIIAQELIRSNYHIVRYLNSVALNSDASAPVDAQTNEHDTTFTTTNNYNLTYDHIQPGVTSNTQPLYAYTNNSNNSNNNSRFMGRTTQDILRRFLEPVEIYPTETQIEAATRIVRFSDIVTPNNNSCPISLEPFREQEYVSIIRHCGHIFKTNQLNTWFRSNCRCPVCRYDIRDYNTESRSSNIDVSNNIINEHYIYSEQEHQTQPLDQQNQYNDYADTSNNILQELFANTLTDYFLNNIYVNVDPSGNNVLLNYDMSGNNIQQSLTSENATFLFTFPYRRNHTH